MNRPCLAKIQDVAENPPDTILAAARILVRPAIVERPESFFKWSLRPRICMKSESSGLEIERIHVK